MPNEGWDKKTIALALFILFGSGSGIGNLIAPNLRSGAFTEADFLEEKAILIAEMEELSDDIALLQLQSSQIMDDDMECLRRQRGLQNDLNNLREIVTTYQARTIEVDANQSKLIAECMQRTR